jgi:hypothetical protein
MMENNRSFLDGKKYAFHAAGVFHSYVDESWRSGKWSHELDYETVQEIFPSEPQKWPPGTVDNSQPDSPLRILYPSSKEIRGVIAFEPGKNVEQQPFLLLPGGAARGQRQLFDSHFSAFSERNDRGAYLTIPNFESEGRVGRAILCFQMISYNLLAVLRRSFQLGTRRPTTSEAIRNFIILPGVESSGGHKRTVSIAVPDDWPDAWRKNIESSAQQLLIR